jgi:hypothetical protein
VVRLRDKLRAVLGVNYRMRKSTGWGRTAPASSEQTVNLVEVKTPTKTVGIGPRGRVRITKRKDVTDVQGE